MKIRLSIKVLALCLSSWAYGQNFFAVSYEGTVNLVTKVTPDDYLIQHHGEEVRLRHTEATPFLMPTAAFLPGYLKIDGEDMSTWDADEQDRRVADKFYFKYRADITSNRDLQNPFLVFRWVRDDQSAFQFVFPLGSLEQGKNTQVSFNFFVDRVLRLTEPEIHYMAMGVEIGTSRTIDKPITPYAYAVQNAANGTLPDGNLKPISMPPLPQINDADGNPRTGVAHLYMSVDEEGYVTAVTVKDSSDWVFGKTALMVAPFFLFQPKIENGEPVATKVLVPFNFK